MTDGAVQAAAIERDIARTRQRLGGTLDALTHRLRTDPLALGLIGVGLAWLAAENAGIARRAGTAGAKGAAGSEPAAADGRRLEGFAARHPLLLGLLGLAAGVAAAALLPPSRPERRLYVRTRQELWRHAEAVAHRAAAGLRALGPASPSDDNAKRSE